MYTYTCIGCIPLQDATGKHGFMMYIYGIIFYRCHVLCAPAALNNHKKTLGLRDFIEGGIAPEIEKPHSQPSVQR